MENYFPEDYIHKLMELSSADRLESIYSHLTSAARLKARKEQVISAADYQNLTNVNLSLEDLRKYFAVADHQLLRLFKASIGLSPKRFLRGSRFSKVLELIRNKKFTNLGDLAFSLNYYDQSHFIKDFRYLSGMTPSDFASLCEFHPGKVSEYNTFFLRPSNHCVDPRATKDANPVIC
ncbi:helix-turn-helix transcriptional regulator [Pedobacter ginsengiterrae]|uniref:helix-turn-helix domain-containing protein n=1 Tax=Pedobacter ginsengiterrae TaxID=871696 RepID=UPI0031E3F0A4